MALPLLTSWRPHRLIPCTECLHLLAAPTQEMEAEISRAASVATYFADRRWSTLSGAPPLEDKRHLGGDADNEEQDMLNASQSSSAVPHLEQELRQIRRRHQRVQESGRAHDIARIGDRESDAHDNL